MIRVFHTIDTAGPGGAETVFVNLIKGLDPQTFESVVAIPGPGWVCDKLRANGIAPLFIQSQGGFSFRYLCELVRIVKKFKIDIIQSHLLGSNIYCSLAGMICRVPVISTFHGFVDAKKKERLLWLKVRLINMGNRKIVFVSNRLRKHYVKNLGVSDRKSIVIYNGVDTNEYYPNKDHSIRVKLGIEPKKIVVGALGNIRPAKGYDVFLKAARIVFDNHPECVFVVAGQGAGHLYESLLHLCKRLELDKVFYFIGFQSDNARYLNNLNIFVLPSISEGFSISTIEALACGVPVVVTASGGPEEIVINGKNGIMVKSGEMDIANGITQMIEKPENRKAMSEQGVRDVAERFSLQAMIDQYQTCYKQLLK